MKKTLLLTHEYFPFRGGVGRYCYQLFKRMPSDDYLVLTDQVIKNGDSHVHSRKLISKLIRPSWVYGIFIVWKFAVNNDVKMIFTPHIFPLGSICYFLNMFTRIPYIISLHGLDINLALMRNKRLAMNILRNAEHIVANSQATADIIEPLKFETKVTVITPYLDQESIPVDEKTLNELKKKYDGKKIILTVGRLVKRKGQDTMIRVMPKIVKEIPNAYYLIIGSGPSQAYMKRLIVDNHIFDAVEILDDVSDHELSAYYKLANLFAMPSRKRDASVEGFGIVYLHAAYFSLPIVAGNSGGENEAVGGDSCGVILDGRDEKGLSEAVIHILKDEDISKYLATNAHEHLQKLPKWDVQSALLQKIIS